MKNAIEMRKITNKAIEDNMKAIREKTIEFIENNIMPTIEENAKLGYSSVMIGYDNYDISSYDIMELLKEYDYEVTYKDNTFIIKW